MPCMKAMLTDVISVRPDQTVADAIHSFEDQHLRSVPVVDADGKFHGMLSIHDLMKFLIPPSYFLAHVPWHLDFIMGATEDKARILADLEKKTVRELMNEEIVTAKPDTPISEAIRLLFQNGSPLPVVDQNKKLVGLVSEQSVLQHLKDTLHDKGE
ncbi:CBS domain-containing protein [Micavibrio aeruginosavorus]|uniref:CBS domain-containing protein n=1 Tax=Micavibrio aeruginosavorus TaxID=349221 RepID=UPI003F4A8E47